MSYEESGKKSKLPGCLMGCLVLISFFIITLAVLYVVVWRVPDRSAELKAMEARVENRFAIDASVSPDKNAWTYYKKAIEDLDLSALDKQKSTKLQSTQGYYGGISDIRGLAEKGINAQNIEIARKIAKANTEVLKNVDEGFRQDVFSSGPPDFNKAFSPSSSGKMPDQFKIYLLGYYLNLMGDLENWGGDSKKSAQRYLESYYLEEGSNKGQILLFFSYMDSTYGGVALDRLRGLLDKLDLEGCKLVARNLDRIKTADFAEATEQRLFLISQWMDYLAQGKTPGGASQPMPAYVGYMKPVFARERNVVGGWVLDIIESYKKDPLKIVDCVREKQPPRFAFSSSMFNSFSKIYTENFCRRQAMLNGLRLLTAARMHKLQKGRNPQNLEQLVPDYVVALPVDLFAKDGKYIYRVKDDKITMYSVGPNRKDDNADGDDIIIKKPENK